MEHSQANLNPDESRRLSGGRPWLPAVIGVVLIVAGYLVQHWDDSSDRSFWFAYVTGYGFVLSLVLGAVLFVMLQHVTRSGWSVVLRRPAEVMAACMPMMVLLFVPIAALIWVGHPEVYPWAVRDLGHASSGDHAVADGDASHHNEPPPSARADQPHLHASENPGGAARDGDSAETGGDALEGDSARAEARGSLERGDLDHGSSGHGHAIKNRAYLNAPFLTVRWAVYFALWIGLGHYFRSRSVRQDTNGDPALTRGMEKLSAPGILLVVVALTFAAIDLLMSLDPHWFSTMFGVYYMSGAVVGFLAVFILILMALQNRGLLTHSVTVEHYHDLGKLLFAFVFFWGYIAFSQYMLIWYGNIPEETHWLARRGAAEHEPNAWSYVLIVLLLGHFVFPFAGLLSRHVKRNRAALKFWAVWMLAMHWIDLCWVVLPELGPQVWFGSAFVLGGMLFLVGAMWVYLARKADLLPIRDPRLAESLAFENT